jgi:hypothetical protein
MDLRSYLCLTKMVERCLKVGSHFWGDGFFKFKPKLELVVFSSPVTTIPSSDFYLEFITINWRNQSICRDPNPFTFAPPTCKLELDTPVPHMT